ncbi:hypothetical protein F2Q68_00020517 [Brassica cretica]|uniref:Uncharacterized protein n=1 Tax=Brassica cretica TaxID=69181 RepID=A0A8S9FZ42_BRACR|nr:hypothetical protein F2Q68_00020517 [Brassica cretica]
MSKITYPRGDLLDTLSVKALERKFQKETGPKNKLSSSTDGQVRPNARPARPSAELDLSSSADGRAGSNARPVQPSTKMDQSSSADGRSGSNAQPAQPSTKLDQSSSTDGRAGSKVRPARPSAELDQSSSTDGRARTIALFSSCLQCSSPKIVSNSLLFCIDRSYHWNFIIGSVRTHFPE